ncbi:calcium/sodium antiporter [Halomicroarcula sp. GCM10025324]|uniref:calcium/sodium antiporter n=1 Tax=Haloarcula TaxID=2237 RepID=UPI0023E8A6E1|nr:calcium/sodium antiporter [Halomicroarcula sp. ZS-22-S1]
MAHGSPFAHLAVVALSVIGLWVGARLLVDTVVRIARRFGLSDLVIGLTVVSMGTSMPELAVSTDAAVKSLGDIAVANVLGSNVYNLAFILGVVALIHVLPVTDSLLRRDGLALLASTAVGGLALLDLSISRLEGALLVGLFVAYTGYLLRATPTEPAAEPDSEADHPATTSLAGRFSFPGRDPLAVVVALGIVLVSGDAMVGAASALASGAGLSDWVIGGTIVAAGTSTPEFAVSLVAVRRGSLGVSVGNVVGSNIFNLLGILGLAALVRPLGVSPVSLETLAWLVAVTVLAVAALWTGRSLTRPEGAAFAASELGRWVLGLLGIVG